MISVNKLHIVGRWERVPADLPGIQYIHTYNIHTDNNKYYRVPVGAGSRCEPVPVVTGGDGFPPRPGNISNIILYKYHGNGFPPSGSGAGSRRGRRNRFPPTGMHMYMGYWTYVRGK